MKRPSSDDMAGIYITVIVHLTVIIILLASQIGASLKKENTFVLDFTKQEQQEQKKEKADFKQDVSRKLDEILSSSSGVPVRNIAVNRSSALKDDRNTDAKQLYQDAEKLAEDLKSGQRQKIENNDDYVSDPTPQKTVDRSSKKEYTGPSVASYSLDGRKASHLSIPAYRCLGGGEVTVIIEVSPQGSVVNAKIQDDVSSSDGCLRSFAIRAARLSTFSANPSAPSKQLGNIVYLFIAQ